MSTALAIQRVCSHRYPANLDCTERHDTAKHAGPVASQLVSEADCMLYVGYQQGHQKTLDLQKYTQQKTKLGVANMVVTERGLGGKLGYTYGTTEMK